MKSIFAFLDLVIWAPILESECEKDFLDSSFISLINFLIPPAALLPFRNRYYDLIFPQFCGASELGLELGL